MSAHRNCYGDEIDLFGEQGVQKFSKGYRAAPGTGPEGETCGTCGNRHKNMYRSGRNYYKCGLIAHTHGRATDIALKSKACNFWKEGDGTASHHGY